MKTREKRLPKSIRIYIRRQKQKLRKEIKDPVKLQEEIEKLCKRIFTQLKIKKE